MIYVINYDKGKRKQLYAKLDALRQPFEIGANETIALKADKIILPDADSPFSALRRLHFLNLHSALRMYKKPVMGIGTGFLLMLKKCDEKTCFSFFPYEAKYFEERDVWEIYDEKGEKVRDKIFRNGRFFGVYDKNESLLNEALIEFVNY